MFLDPSYWSFIGLGVGFLIAGVSFILTAAYINLHRHNFMAWFDNAVGQTSLFKIATKVDTFGAFVGVALDFEGLFGILEDFGENYYKIPMVIFSLGTGVASLACATQFLLKFGGHYEKHPSLSLYKYNADSKIDISLLFGLSSICIGLLFIFIAGTVLWEE